MFGLHLQKIKIKGAILLALFVATLLPVIASAQAILGDSNQISKALGAIVAFIQGVLIPFLFAIGFFMFVWGVIKFFVIGGNNEDAKKEGKDLIIYALAGFVIILIFWGVVNIIAGGIGLQSEGLMNTPTLPGGGQAPAPFVNDGNNPGNPNAPGYFGN